MQVNPHYDRRLRRFRTGNSDLDAADARTARHRTSAEGDLGRSPSEYVRQRMLPNDTNGTQDRQPQLRRLNGIHRRHRRPQGHPYPTSSSWTPRR